MAKTKSKAAYMISAVAEQYEIHPQTLRLYEREGLLTPSRSDGNTRLYTDEDLERLEVILKLTRDLGVNLAGVEIILNMREKMEAMQQQIEGFISNLNHELSMRATTTPKEEDLSLMPVIQLGSLARDAVFREVKAAEGVELCVAPVYADFGNHYRQYHQHGSQSRSPKLRRGARCRAADHSGRGAGLDRVQ
jgi:MerR family transcriptional regulator/heat shock protein HspR